MRICSCHQRECGGNEPGSYGANRSCVHFDPIGCREARKAGAEHLGQYNPGVVENIRRAEVTVDDGPKLSGADSRDGP